jgi:hypothetical protein
MVSERVRPSPTGNRRHAGALFSHVSRPPAKSRGFFRVPPNHPGSMTLEEATALAQQQADKFSVVMIVVKDDLSEDSGGYECCAEIYRDTLYPDHHKEFWEIAGRIEPR